MRKPEHSTEPSIEEILDSIRSIITDDAAPPSKVSRKPHNDDRENTSERNMPAAFRSDNTLPSETSEEVLELTEDFMLMEPLEDMPRQQLLSDNPPQSEKLPNTETSSNAFIPGPPQEEGNLNEVFSNLVAEMDRLSAPEPNDDTPPNEGRANNEPDTPTSDSYPAKARQASIHELPEATDHTVGQPQISGIAEPQTATSAPQSASISTAHTPAPAQKPKQVWSARRLEQTKPSASHEKSTARDSEEAGDSATAAPQQQEKVTVSRRDLWAEGIQIPVPDTGPEMPLPMQDDGRINAETKDTGSETANNDQNSKRRIVGSFLNRVFGEPSSDDTETSSSEQEEIRTQAEKLAHETIASFAEEKLNAPALGNALKSDKDFMNEVASSLESALAETSEKDDEEAVSESATAPALPDVEPVEGSHAEKTAAHNLDVALKEALDAEAGTEAEDLTNEGIPASELADEYSEAANQEALPEENSVTPKQLSADEVPEDNAVNITKEHSAESVEDTPEEGNKSVVAPLMSPLKLPASLETGIKEMIKPLIIQWLNENLPRIVEDAVREELSERSAITDIKAKSSA